MDRILVLELTVGLPFAGKSTWARRQGSPIVSPDAIRESLHGQRYLAEAEPVVWTMARYMVRALFLAGHDTVIVDATNNTRRRRSTWRSDLWTCKFMVMPSDADACIARASEAGCVTIVPVIERMAAEYEPVERAEGEIHLLN